MGYKKGQKYTKDPIQTTLFDMSLSEEEMKDKMVVLYEPTPEQLKKVTDDLMHSYTKDEIYQQARVFHPMLRDKLVMLQKADGSRVPAKDMLPLFSMSSNKESLTRALAYILSEPRNLLPYVNSLSKEMRLLWQHMLLYIWTSEETAKDILGTTDDVFSKPRYSYYYGDVSWNKRGFDFFNLSRSLSANKERWGYRGDRFYMRVNSYVQGLFFPLFFPEANGDPTMAELPDGEHIHFNFERECFEKYKLLSSLLQTGKVGITSKGASIADVKRTAKQLGLVEFFDGSDPLQANIRANFYIAPLALTGAFLDKKSQKASDYAATLRSLTDKLSSIRYYLPSLLLPHIKGLRKAMTDENRMADLCNFMLEWLKMEPERWTPIEAIFIKMYVCNVGSDYMQSCALVFPHAEQTSGTEIVNEFTGKALAVDRFVPEFGLVTIQAFAFILCSLGMAELTLVPSANNPTAGNVTPNYNLSPFSRAEYIRLTPLGRYVLGINTEYEAPEPEHVAYFELDPDRLIIRSLVEPNPYAQLLLDTSTAISRNRFETSAESFLAHCQTQADVEEKIGIFKQFISHQLPPLWKQFFDSLIQHCNPLRTDRTSYQKYRIDPQNTELIQLLTTDPKLRQLTIRAEGYLLLVEKENLKRFTDELKKHGYLL